MTHTEQESLFLLQYALGEYPHLLEDKFPYHYKITESLELMNKVEPIKKLRDYMTLRNYILKNKELFETTYDKFLKLEEVIKELNLTYYDVEKPMFERFIKEGDFEGYELGASEAYNSVVLALGNIQLEAYSLFIAKEDSVLKDFARCFYISPLTELEYEKFNPEEMFTEGSNVVNDFKGGRLVDCTSDTDLLNLVNKANNTEYTGFDVAFDWAHWGINNELQFTHKDSSVYYVDCDNMQCSSFFKLLNVLEKHTDITVKLFVDESSRTYWKNIKSDIYNGIKVDVIEVGRLIGSKSVVDQVLIGTLLKDEAKNKVVVSSDSDYFSLNILGVNYSVLIDSDNTSVNYINYLKEKEIKYTEIQQLTGSTHFAPIIDTICKNASLDYLRSTILTHWTEGVLLCYLTIMLKDELMWDIDIEEEYAKTMTKYILDNIQLSRQNGTTFIGLEDIKKEVHLVQN